MRRFIIKNILFKFPGWDEIRKLRANQIPFFIKGTSSYFFDAEFGPSQFNDLLIKKTSRKENFLHIAKDGLIVYPKYKGELTPDKIYIDKLYKNGHTIVINNISKSDMPSLFKAKSIIENTLNEEIKNLIFITPANSHGFPPHFDSGDLFVVQMYGAKEWTLYKKSCDVPLKPEIVIEKGPIIFREVVERGDVLYIPKGVVHEARNNLKQSSVHISFGIFP